VARKRRWPWYRVGYLLSAVLFGVEGWREQGWIALAEGGAGAVVLICMVMLVDRRRKARGKTAGLAGS
jgi:hypothetical protein